MSLESDSSLNLPLFKLRTCPKCGGAAYQYGMPPSDKPQSPSNALKWSLVCSNPLCDWNEDIEAAKSGNSP